MIEAGECSSSFPAGNTRVSRKMCLTSMVPICLSGVTMTGEYARSTGADDSCVDQTVLSMANSTWSEAGADIEAIAKR